MQQPVHKVTHLACLLASERLWFDEQIQDEQQSSHSKR